MQLIWTISLAQKAMDIAGYIVLSMLANRLNTMLVLGFAVSLATWMLALYCCDDFELLVGSAPVLVGMTAASATYKLRTSQHSPLLSTAELSLATPMRVLPI